MRRPRLGAKRLVLLVLTPLLLFYAFVIVSVAWAMIRDPRFASRGTGLALLVLVAVGIGLVVAELRFGRQVEALSREYEPGGWTEVGPDAGMDEFDRVSLRVQERPDDWRRWYELGLAYGDARDTMRGRRALRKAVALHREGAT
jgi:hypothetical protein